MFKLTLPSFIKEISPITDPKPIVAKAITQAFALDCPPLKSRANPAHKGPSNAPVKPSMECGKTCARSTVLLASLFSLADRASTR